MLIRTFSPSLFLSLPYPALLCRHVCLCRASLSAGCFILASTNGPPLTSPLSLPSLICPIIVASSLSLDISILFHCLLCCWRSLYLVFALLLCLLCFWLLITLVLIYLLPPSGACSNRSLLFDDCFSVASILEYKDAVSMGLPVYLHAQLLEVQVCI